MKVLIIVLAIVFGAGVNAYCIYSKYKRAHDIIEEETKDIPPEKRDGATS